jgi:SAM-dependent methyltransferase
MRNWTRHDQYVTKLYSDVYEQPEDAGHTVLAQRVIDHWMSRLTTCQSVLDVGCGTGFCQPMFNKWEISYEGIALGEDVVTAQSLGRNVKRMDFSFLEYPDNSFDMIFSRHSLEHSPMPLLTLMEWARVSQNWLGIVLPAPEWYTFKGRNHYSVMYLEQAKNMLDVAGWNVIWDEVDHMAPDPSHNSEDKKPHEYWIMCEKKR